MFVNSLSPQAGRDRKQITDDFKHLRLLSLQRRGNQHCRLNGVAVDDAVLLQNRKFRLIRSILVSKCFARSN